jgi:hypothetical protein
MATKKQKCIFINTDIFLEYFEMSSATKASLEWLLRALKRKELKLILPKQVEDEFWRRKYEVVQKTRGDIIKKIPQELNKLHFPTPIKNIPETKKVRVYILQIKNLIEKLVKKYDKECPKTEILIKNIFKEAERLNDDDVIDKAHQRFLKGNPPGKNKSYGDAIIWETLLEKCSNENLTIITEELDWYNDKDKKSLKEFLMVEWKNKTKKKLKFNLSLAAFINEFTGKETIKKKVVQEEKASKEYFPPLSGVSGILNKGTVIAGDLYREELLRAAPSAYDFLKTVRPSWVKGTLSKNTCPYCLKENEPDANYCSCCGRILLTPP